MAGSIHHDRNSALYMAANSFLVNEQKQLQTFNNSNFGQIQTFVQIAFEEERQVGQKTAGQNRTIIYGNDTKWR